MAYKRTIYVLLPLVLLVVAANSSIQLPLVASQTTVERPTYVFISVSPTTVGVGQSVNVMFWLDSAPPTAAGAGGDRWQNLTVQIEKPDGSIEIQGPFKSDAVGGAFMVYTPIMTGKYYFQCTFPGQTIAGTYYQPSSSRKAELSVQQEAIHAWGEFPLPTGYWSRPINAENRLWYQIAGNWLMPGYNTTVRAFDTGGGFNPYTTAPESPHIIWTKELAFGGLVGGEFGAEVDYYTGMSYEMKFTPPAVINGRLYYNDPKYPRDTFYCVDLRTGEQLWTQTVPAVSPPPASIGGIMPGNIPITLGQIYDYESPNQHGANAYLWSINGPGNEWKMYDAFTGTLMITFKNASNGFLAFGEKGELLCYLFSGTGYWLAMWNSSKAIPPAWPSGSGAWQWRPALTGTELDWRQGIQWNVTAPKVVGVPTGLGASPLTLNWVGSGNVILAEAVVPPSQGESWPTFVHVAYDASTGEQLWVQNRTNMGWGFGGAGRPGLMWTVACPQPRDGVYVVYQKETEQWHAFSVITGDKLWSTESLSKYSGTDWSMYDMAAQIAYGKLYVTGYDGCVHAFDLKTGAHLWTFSVGSSGFETPYGTWPFYGGLTIADHKLYVANGEHSPGPTMWRGEKLYCIDAETGKPLWNVSGWFVGNSLAIADGYIVGYNGYDNRIYAFGKGKTAVEITASPEVTTKGGSILIKGKVLDKSPAAKDTPCVSDIDMAPWMEYLLMQHPMPQNVQGVTVQLYAINQKGETIDVGTTITDPLREGAFSYLWKPPSEGTYTIMAVFPGSNAYWDSYAATAIGITEAAEQSNIAATNAYLIAAIMVLIALIVVSVALLKQRK